MTSKYLIQYFSLKSPYRTYTIYVLRLGWQKKRSMLKNYDTYRYLARWFDSYLEEHVFRKSRFQSFYARGKRK